jgi:hypothetical protein
MVYVIRLIPASRMTAGYQPELINNNPYKVSVSTIRFYPVFHPVLDIVGFIRLAGISRNQPD